MNMICSLFFALACLSLVGGGYLFFVRWNETAWWIRGGLVVAFFIGVLGVGCFRHPRLFGSGCGMHGWLRRFAGGGQAWESICREQQQQQALGQGAGDWLRQQGRGGRCIILRAPQTVNLDQEPVTDWVVKGLRLGLEDAYDDILEVSVPMNDEQATAPEEAIGLAQTGWTVRELESLLNGLGPFDALIACFPLPDDCFDERGDLLVDSLVGKRLMLCAGVWGNAQKAVQSGKAGAVLPRQECQAGEEPQSGDWRACFDRHYELRVPGATGAVSL